MTSRSRLHEVRELKPKQKSKNEGKRKNTERIKDYKEFKETKEKLCKTQSKTKLKFDPKLAKQNLKKVRSYFALF